MKGLRWLARMLLGRARPAPAGPSGPRFLFLNYETALGHAVVATTTFAALKARRPDAYIAVAACGLTANLLRASPLVDELIVTPHALTDTRRALSFFLRHIYPRRKAFDYVATVGGNERSRVALLALASGVSRRVGLTLRPELYTAGLLYDRSLSNITNNMRVLDAAGLPSDPAEPAVHFTASDLAAVQTLLAEAPNAQGPRIAVVAASSKGHPNEWFDERWAELVRRLAENLGAQIVFTGAKGDAAQIDAIRQAAGVATFSAAGRTDLPQLAALMALSDLVVSIDTGGLHVARAVNAPSVVLANAAQPDHWWLPPKDDERFHILRHGHVPCALCLKFACATRECMQESTVDQVERAVIEHLAAHPPSSQARARRTEARTYDRRAAT
jgi:ADP-heptose:LPS heptosyltransferase